MPRYLVQWEIDLEDMESPRAAAEHALGIQRNPDSIATVFEIHECDADGVLRIPLRSFGWQVDLTENAIDKIVVGRAGHTVRQFPNKE